MTRIVRTAHRTKRPLKRKSPVALAVPAVVKAAELAKSRSLSSGQGRGPSPASNTEPAAPPPPANDDRTPAPSPAAEAPDRHQAAGGAQDLATTGLSPLQQYWSGFDDAALLEIAAETLADLRSGEAQRQHGAREQLQELQSELRRRGVWGDKKGSLTTPDVAEPTC
jgi:hypothetical protein